MEWSEYAVIASGFFGVMFLVAAARFLFPIDGTNDEKHGKRAIKFLWAPLLASLFLTAFLP